MTRSQRAALGKLDITAKRYCLEGNYDASWTIGEDGPVNWRNVPIWGLRLSRAGETLCVIESTVPELDRKFYLRHSERGIAIASAKTQRESIAAAARRGLLG